MSPTELPAALLRKCAAGDQKAFERLYRLESPRLYAVCLRILRDEDLAQEALQDGFMRLWHRAGSFDPRRGRAAGWMTTIVRNRALDLLRGARQGLSEADVDVETLEFGEESAGPFGRAVVDADAKAVLACLEQLPPAQRRCILMAYYHGHTHEELSRLLRTPLGTIKAWIRRGLERVRQCLG
jgi:RNA polymerase sigma-70 factor (ECF subfamily)